MSTWNTVKVAVSRFGLYLYLACFYRYWSRLYRFIWEFKYSTVTLDTYRTFGDLVKVMQSCVWKKDGWQQIWDAFSYPGKVQFIINTQEPKEREIGDCDEFAIYLANVLEQSSIYGGFENGRYMLEPWSGFLVDRARILTVCWMDSKGKFAGHNVCLIDFFDPKTQNPIAPCQSFSYQDYDFPNNIQPNIHSVVTQVISRYAPGGTCLGWSIHDKNLKLEQLGWGLYT